MFPARAPRSNCRLRERRPKAQIYLYNAKRYKYKNILIQKHKIQKYVQNYRNCLLGSSSRDPQRKCIQCWARITIDSWLWRSVVLNHIKSFGFRFICEILPWNESVSCESCGWKLGIWRRQKVKGVAAIKSLDLWSPYVWNLTLTERWENWK